MKKSLLAVAAIGAFASAAQAQSSVTVYGILDVGYTGSNTRVQASNSATTPNYTTYSAYPNGALRQTQSQFGQSAEQTSRLGFRGTEDLGGGKSAFFTVEVGLTPNSSGASTASTANGTAFNNRQSFVGLADKGMGRLSVGTQYQPIHVAVAATDPGQQNNMTGGLIYMGGADSGIVGAVGGNTSGYQSRASNSINYVSPVVAGFKLTAFGVLNNAESTTLNGTAANAANVSSGGMTNTNGWAAGLDYTWQKLLVTANYAAVKNLTTATNQAAYGTTAAVAGTTNTGAWALWSGAQTATNVQDNTMYAAATYDFGILKAYAQYINRKATDTANSNLYQKRSAQQIGVRSYVTPTIEMWAMGGTGSFTPYGNNQVSAPMNAYQLGSNYWLSKRTNLYAIYGQYSQSTRSYTATTSALATTTGTAAVNSNSYAVGLRHTF
jgi:predicted porin